ncbi:hypothetical protein JXB41_01105 [Candidatus Woesearchaeota archaeon]|nr:hypothetical protein [Candidatus Woesearchaeota archaeon]
MEDLLKKYKNELSVKKQEPVFKEAKTELNFLKTVETKDVLDYYEKKHKEDIKDLMKFMRQ